MVGDLEGYRTVWYYPDGITNILSLYIMACQYYVQYDKRSSKISVVWKDGGSSREFTPGPKGLYYCDFSKTKGVLLAMESGDLVDEHKISTVKEYSKQFNQR